MIGRGVGLGLITRLARGVVLGGVAALVTACVDAPPAEPPLLTLTEAGGSRPSAAVAADAAVLVAWVDAGGDVRLARVVEGGVEEVVRVNDIAGDAAAHEQAPAQVAVGPDGGVFVVWQNNREVPGRRFPASDLRFARSADGGRSFEPAVTVNDDAGGPPASHTFHDMVVGANGTIHVSWIDGRASAAGDSVTGPEIRVASSRDDGRSFSASVVVAQQSCPCCRTSLAVAPDGRLAVAWRSVRDGNVRDIAVAVSEDGGRSWGEPIRAHEDGWRIDGCPHAGPSLAWDVDGRLHVAWYTGMEGRQGLWYAVSDAAVAEFGPALPVSTGEWVPPSLVSLAADGGGVRVAWDDRRSDPVVVRVGRMSERGLEEEEVVGGRAPSLVVGPGASVLALVDGEGAVRARVWR